MKNKSLILALIFVMASVSLFSQDYNIALDTGASVSRIADTSAEFSQAANVFFTTPVGTDFTFVASGGLRLALSYDGAESSTEFVYPSQLGDIDLRELSFTFKKPMPDEGMNSFTYAIGRFPYTDTTGALYSYRLDGLTFQTSYPLFSFKTVLGYSGFLPGAAPLITTLSDDSYGNDGFAPPRVIAAFSLRNIMVKEHELYVSLIAHEDLREESTLVPEYETIASSTDGGPADGAYFTFGFSSPVSSTIAYSAYGAFQFGRRLSYIEDTGSATEFSYQYKPIRAFSMGASMRMPINRYINLAARFVFGTGDDDPNNQRAGDNTDGDANFFLPITRASSGLVFSPQAGNVTLLGITLNGKPFPGNNLGPKALALASDTFIFIKNGKGPISEAGADPDASTGLLGLEQDVTASLKLLSDLQVSLSLGAFVPIAAPAGAFDESSAKDAPVQFTVKAGLSLVL